MNVKEDMILFSSTAYDMSSNGFEIGILDFQNAIKYYEELDAKDTAPIIEGLRTKLSWLQKKKSFRILQNKTIMLDPFYYNLRVLEVVDSTAITKVHSKRPYVKIRVGDRVAIH